MVAESHNMESAALETMNTDERFAMILFDVCIAVETSRPLKYHATTPKIRPQARTPTSPEMSYECIYAKNAPWMTIGIIGILIHEPKDCITKPLKSSSSEKHWKGITITPSTKAKTFTLSKLTVWWLMKTSRAENIRTIKNATMKDLMKAPHFHPP